MVEELNFQNLFIQGAIKAGCINTPTVIRGIVKRRQVKEAETAKVDYFYMDTGYFGNFKTVGNPSGRKIWHRVVKNELQKSVLEFWPSDRWEKLVRGDKRLKWPGWKKKGKSILLILPNPKSCNFFDLNYDIWYKETIDTIKANTDRPIIERVKGSRGERNEYSIYDALDEDVFATVAFNSIAAMESIAYGVPAFVKVPCAAWPLASKDLSLIEQPYYPDEQLVQQHCRSLAYGQFLEEELVDGTAWRTLNNEINRKR